jgi:hypothetical protein
MSRCFVTESWVGSGDRVRPTTRPLSLFGDLRFRSSARSFAGLHPEDAGRADAGAAQPRQGSYQREQLRDRWPEG